MGFSDGELKYLQKGFFNGLNFKTILPLAPSWLYRFLSLSFKVFKKIVVLRFFFKFDFNPAFFCYHYAQQEADGAEKKSAKKRRPEAGYDKAFHDLWDHIEEKAIYEESEYPEREYVYW